MGGRQPLTGDDATERGLIGRTLAGAHAILADDHEPPPHRWHWVDPAAPHLDVEPWIRPTVAAVAREVDRLETESLTFGSLHGDPAPEAFRRDPSTGVCGLIDWASSVRGPLLYDLASARMYLGGGDASAPLVEAYLPSGNARGLADARRALGVG